MPISFFQKEVRKAQDSFNEVYNGLVCVNLQTRVCVLLSIVGLGRLANRIDAAARPDDVRDLIKEFMRRKIIMQGFMERALKERREYDARISRHQESHDRDRHMFSLRQRVPDYPAQKLG